MITVVVSFARVRCCLARIFHTWSGAVRRCGLVAQVSNLLCRRFPTGRPSQTGRVRTGEREAGWKPCDSADWKSALRRWQISGLVLLAVGWFGEASLFAQFDGPASTGVSASLVRLFGTNNAFTAQMELQVLGPDNKERVGTPMIFTLTGNRIRVDVDMTRMRNRDQPDAIAQVKPLGLDRVVSIIQSEQRTTLIMFPKLRAFVKLDMPPTESAAFLKRAKIERTPLSKEKMEGYACVKQRVVITDDAGKKSEATVWAATGLGDFPVCVATKEKGGTVVIRFRKIQFGRAAASQFEPPAGFTECADMQVLMAGPVVQYMKENKTAVKAGAKATPAPKAKTTPAKPAPKKK